MNTIVMQSWNYIFVVPVEKKSVKEYIFRILLIKCRLIRTLLTVHLISMQLMVTMHWPPNSSKFSHLNNQHFFQHGLIGSVIAEMGVTIHFKTGKNSSTCQAQTQR